MLSTKRERMPGGSTAGTVRHRVGHAGRGRLLDPRVRGHRHRRQGGTGETLHQTATSQVLHRALLVSGATFYRGVPRGTAVKDALQGVHADSLKDRPLTTVP